MNRVQIAKELVKVARALSAAEDSDEPFSLMLKDADGPQDRRGPRHPEEKHQRSSALIARTHKKDIGVETT